jgi:hypothetical protein
MLLQLLKVALLLSRGQSEEVADEIGDFQLLLAREDLRERGDVVEDGLAHFAALILNHAEDVGDFFENEGRPVAVRVVVDLDNLLHQV